MSAKQSKPLIPVEIIEMLIFGQTLGCMGIWQRGFILYGLSSGAEYGYVTR